MLSVTGGRLSLPSGQLFEGGGSLCTTATSRRTSRPACWRSGSASRRQRSRPPSSIKRSMSRSGTSASSARSAGPRPHPLYRRDPGPVRPDRPGRAARQPRGLWPGLPDPRAELGPGLFRLDVRFRRQPRARRLPVRPPRRHLQRPGGRDRPAARQAGHGVSRPAILLAGALHVLLPRRQLRLHRARHPCALGRQPGRPRGRARHAG